MDEDIKKGQELARGLPVARSRGEAVRHVAEIGYKLVHPANQHGKLWRDRGAGSKMRFKLC